MYSGSCTQPIAFRGKHTHGRICIYTYIYIVYVYLWHCREVWDKTERLWDDNPPTAPWRSIEIALKSSHHGWRISVILLDWTERQTQANPHSSHVRSCHRWIPPQFLFFSHFDSWISNRCCLRINNLNPAGEGIQRNAHESCWTVNLWKGRGETLRGNLC